jgi:hypothetical protein
MLHNCCQQATCVNILPRYRTTTALPRYRATTALPRYQYATNAHL